MSFIKMMRYMSVQKQLSVLFRGIIQTTYFANLLINKGVPSALLLLCPTGYSTWTSSSCVPSFSSTRSAFPIDLLSGAWYSALKRLSSTQYILALSASMRGSEAEASELVLEMSAIICGPLWGEDPLALRGKFTKYQWIGNHIIDGMAIKNVIRTFLISSGKITLTLYQQNCPKDPAYRWCE